MTDDLLDAAIARGGLDVIADPANPLPAIFTTGLVGRPSAHHEQLKAWSETFAEVLGNFEHNPGR